MQEPDQPSQYAAPSLPASIPSSAFLGLLPALQAAPTAAPTTTKGVASFLDMGAPSQLLQVQPLEGMPAMTATLSPDDLFALKDINFAATTAPPDVASFLNVNLPTEVAQEAITPLPATWSMPTAMPAAALLDTSTQDVASEYQKIQSDAQQTAVALQQTFQKQMSALQPFGAQNAPALIQISESDVCNCPCQQRETELELEYRTVREAQEAQERASSELGGLNAELPPMSFLERKRSLKQGSLNRVFYSDKK